MTLHFYSTGACIDSFMVIRGVISVGGMDNISISTIADCASDCTQVNCHVDLAFIRVIYRQILISV